MQEQIEKYRILEEIGHGGMSVVYRGHDDTLDRDVAVKVMHRHLARDPAARERFSREARAVARLTHQNIPEIYDFSASSDELNYLVTELVTGAPLSKLLRDGPAFFPEVGAMLVLQIAHALEHAHAHQIIHRDVKPENILVGLDGIAKLTDFGIAQIVGLESMTVTGTLVGSPAHMAPEQIEGQLELDYRTDLWALGTVLYVTITGGTLPFDASTPHGILKKIVEGRYEDPRRLSKHVNSQLEAIIDRCLQVDREARYESAGALEADLRKWLEDREIKNGEDEIRAWMNEPEAYCQDLSKRLVTTLMRQGDKANEAGSSHLALEAYGRVLTLDGDHQQALRGVRQLNSGIRWRRVGRIVSQVLMLAALIMLAVWLWPEPAPTPNPSYPPGRALMAVAVPPSLPRFERKKTLKRTAGQDAGKALGTVSDRINGIDKNRRKKGSESAGRKLAEKGRDLVPVQFSVYPPAVQLNIAGKTIAPGSITKLKPGIHAAILKHPGCADCKDTRRRIRIVASPGRKVVRKHLAFEFNPMQVRVNCEDGTVAVDGKVYGPCGSHYLIPVFTPTPRLSKVQVVMKDGRKLQRSFTIKPAGVFRWEAR